MPAVSSAWNPIPQISDYLTPSLLSFSSLTGPKRSMLTTDVILHNAPPTPAATFLFPCSIFPQHESPLNILYPLLMYDLLLLNVSTHQNVSRDSSLFCSLYSPEPGTHQVLNICLLNEWMISPSSDCQHLVCSLNGTCSILPCVVVGRTGQDG